MNFSDVITKYGLEASIIALITIMIIGIIKVAMKKPLEKLGKEKLKPIYESLSVILAYGLSALWLVLEVNVFHMKDIALSWEAVFSAGSMTYVVVKVLYPLYENYHVRDFVKLIVQTVVSLISNRKNPVEIPAEPQQIEPAKVDDQTHTTDQETK